MFVTLWVMPSSIETPNNAGGQLPMKSSPSLILRFSGSGGRNRLIEALQEQQLVGGSVQIARQLAKYAECKHLHPNRTFIKEGDADNDMYFILSGSVSISVQGREIAKRTAGEHIGEMALIDKTAVRSATVCTLESTVLAKLAEPQFSHIANNNPEVWRKIAVTLARRLKERNKFHVPPRSEPVIFIGSSSEGMKIADKINTYLSRFPFVPRLWSKEIFECSQTTIESLMEETKQTDFAILVLTSDDVVKSRGSMKPSPRDNVIFELGLFMGALSRVRTFIVAPAKTHLKIPTDLLGVTCLLFQQHRGKTLSHNLKPILHKLRRLITERGPI
jgi:CRP/FNR family transcriptional regulator, cyclic AMP receptor protein